MPFTSNGDLSPISYTTLFTEDSGLRTIETLKRASDGNTIAPRPMTEYKDPLTQS